MIALNRRRVMGGVPAEVDWSTKYLTIIPLSSSTFKNSINAMDYSTDNGATWTTLSGNTNSPTISAGTKVLLKATITPTSNGGVGIITMSNSFKACGNPLSLILGANFANVTALTGYDNAFRRLFYKAKVTDAQDLALVATTLSASCYYEMFTQSSLTVAPQLPATTLASSCYWSMFNSTGLTEMPELPALTLASDCYRSMFGNCSSLTTVHKLNATTLSSNCYRQMFSGCTSLTVAPEILATTLAASCCYGMFSGCTNLTTSPTLLATTLSSNCYNAMFQNCSSLNYIKAMFTTKPSSSYTNGWVTSVASSGIFVKNSSATWDVTGVNGVPDGWTVQTASS